MKYMKLRRSRQPANSAARAEREGWAHAEVMEEAEASTAPSATATAAVTAVEGSRASALARLSFCWGGEGAAARLSLYCVRRRPPPSARLGSSSARALLRRERPWIRRERRAGFAAQPHAGLTAAAVGTGERKFAAVVQSVRKGGVRRTRTPR
ncbi:hypothetical protein T492DRAFT_834761 [Pavlovales sp. CCMP2436]|nr:hypothetical protein T492DRAFT_834761 [Pavlovales sp. CCMP2436]